MLVKSKIICGQKFIFKIFHLWHIDFVYKFFLRFKCFFKFSVAHSGFVYTFDESVNLVCRFYNFPKLFIFILFSLRATTRPERTTVSRPAFRVYRYYYSIRFFCRFIVWLPGRMSGEQQ